jgi:hypothetical protein
MLDESGGIPPPPRPPAARTPAEGTLMLEDLDPAETREWLEALDSVLAFEGTITGLYLPRR